MAHSFGRTATNWLVFLALALISLLLIALPGGFSTGQDVTSTPAPLPWTTYEDTDPLLSYSGTWQTFPVAGAVGGGLTATDEPEALLAIRFNGTGIRVLYSKGPEGQPFQGLLDEDWASYPDSYAAAYSYGHDMSFDGLEPGTHTLTVTNGQGAIWIEAVQVQGTLIASSPEFALAFSADFQTLNADGWQIRPSLVNMMWRTSDGNVALRIPGNWPDIVLASGDLDQQMIQLRLLVEGGQAVLALRCSAAGCYRFTLDSNGTAQLWRNENLLAATSVTPLSPDQWVTLKLTLRDNRLEVAVEGQTILTVTDNDPLPAGRFVIEPDENSAIQIDDAAVWLPPDQVSSATPAPAMALAASVAFPDDSIGVTTNLAYRLSNTLYVNGEPFRVNGTTVQVNEVDWSRDGSRLAFTSGSPAITIVGADGNLIRSLSVAGVWFASEVDWSPDGSRIAFSGDSISGGSKNSLIYYVDVNCTNPCTPIPVTLNQPGQDYSPSWSSDGQSITFVSDRGRANPYRVYQDVYVTNLAGTSVRRASPRLNWQTEGESWFAPDWSPDGQWISAAYNEDMVEVRPDRIVIFGSTNPSNYRWLTSPSSVADTTFDSAWKPDSRRVVFSQGAVSARLGFVDISGGAPQLSSVYGDMAGSWERIQMQQCQLELITSPGSGLGLALRDSPTRNSPRLDTIPWSNASTTIYLTPVYRLAVGNAVWYQVNYNGVTGWTPASIEGTMYLNEQGECASLPEPYPIGWSSKAQITQTELYRGNPCDIDGYLRSEDPALVLARISFAEAAVYKNLSNNLIPGTGNNDSTGGSVFSDASLIAWIARLDALLGIPNYSIAHRAGVSVSITEQVISPGAFDPITQLKKLLQTGYDCNPENIPYNPGDPNIAALDPIRKMAFPQNRAENVEVYQLWRIYQSIEKNIYSPDTNRPWSAMLSYTINSPGYTPQSISISGYDQFKGVGVNERCPAGENGLTRPGRDYTWAANQPYAPKSVRPHIDPRFGSDQSRQTCYQDVYHLDDWFWDQDVSYINSVSNTFPRIFCVAKLTNPQNPNDYYYLAQLRGLDGSAWPPDANCPPDLLN